eukprot:9403767-Karenia_brevis.AAC.1
MQGNFTSIDNIVTKREHRWLEIYKSAFPDGPDYRVVCSQKMGLSLDDGVEKVTRKDRNI